MPGLILFSHGSVLCGAGATLHEHAERLRTTNEFHPVEVGFMNYSEPPFELAAERCARAGASTVAVAPYFLVPGKFVRVDLPRHVQQARERWPGVEFLVSEPLGFDPGMADALLQLAAEARGPEYWRDDLLQASAFCEVDPDCPLYGTARCPSTSGSRVDAAALGGPRLASSPRTQDRGEVSAGPAGLLVMVHGSPRSEANEDVYRVVEIVRDRGSYASVQIGFMECNTPTIPDAVEACVRDGAIRIDAVPYFLHTGNHVAEDLPTLLEEAQERYPQVQFRMARFLGTAPRITELIAERARAVLTALPSH